MSASVVIEDKGGNKIPLDSSNPADFGTVASGPSSSEAQLQVTNDGDEDVFFVTISGEQMAAADPAGAVEALRADAMLLRDVYLFGRDFGWVQVRREDEPGFELLEVDR